MCFVPNFNFDFVQVVLGSTRLLSSFTGFYWVFLGISGFHCVSCLVLLGLTVFRTDRSWVLQVPLGSMNFLLVLLGFTEFRGFSYLVLLCFTVSTGFTTILLGFSSRLPIYTDI